ncbi:SDR family NAD(P)-dependent oxidoreductase [Rhodococcus sp. X156]|uniref:SDR family NAD(P)-dependent oxidoreductase n=1 Tax=Rhodococcus sp. X156 TaxID=2499145 RepID=UPI000FDA598C|nr:SDR family NAD(P)-dependent oxidoreductase [Rhodococcus sp. X156]
MTDTSTIDAAKYGPWAVIAGGSEGVGSSFAEQLAAAGINLVLLARKPGPLEETAEKVRALGVEVRTLSVDLIAPGAVEQIRAVTDPLEVGLFIFNAGANTYANEFVTADLTKVQEVIDLNITRQLELSQHFGALMKERGRGGIILLGSMAGYLGTEMIGIYAAAKAFSRVFAEGLWLELKAHDVDVLHLVLGVTRTPSMERHGLKMDLPGLDVAAPADVAAEGLARITEGPVWVAGGEANFTNAKKRLGFPRGPMVEASAKASRKMMGFDE